MQQMRSLSGYPCSFLAKTINLWDIAQKLQ